MKLFTIRPADGAKDAENYTHWLRASSDTSLIDWLVYDYPTINTVVIEADAEPVLMNSFHAVLVLEALAPKPGLDPKDEARALRKLFEGIRNVAIVSGIREIYFTTIDDRVAKFALRKGWDQVNTPVFRMKVGGSSDPLNERRPEGHNTSTE